MQERMCLISGTWRTVPPASPREQETHCPRARRWGGVSQNKCYYPEGTTAKILAEAELRGWKEKEPQRNINTGQGPGRDYHGAHNTRNSQTNNLLGDTREKISAARWPRWLDIERNSSKMTSKIAPSEKSSLNFTESCHRIAPSFLENSLYLFPYMY